MRHAIQNRKYLEMLSNFEYFVCISAKIVRFTSKTLISYLSPSLALFRSSLHGGCFQYISDSRSNSCSSFTLYSHCTACVIVLAPFSLPHILLYRFSYFWPLLFAYMVYIALHSLPLNVAVNFTFIKSTVYGTANIPPIFFIHYRPALRNYNLIFTIAM